jgi:hypothetical protein
VIFGSLVLWQVILGNEDESMYRIVMAANFNIEICFLFCDFLAHGRAARL